MSNIYGRSVIVLLTNKRGSGVIAGDVVILDTGNNTAFTTTTSANFTGGVGIAQETIANNATGRVLISGYAALVNVNASVTRGHFGATFTVAAQATDAGAARGTGTFCQFLTGGTTPTALVYPVDLLGTSLTNPMTTKGDIIQGDTGGTPVRLGAGTSGYVLTAGGAGNFSSWVAPTTALTSARYLRPAASADYTTTSTTFVDVDNTNMNLTITTGAHRVLIGFVGTGGNSSDYIELDVTVDGTLQGGAGGLVIVGPSLSFANLSFAYLTDVLSAASHTFKVQYRANSSGTSTIRSSTAPSNRPLFYVIEQAS